MEEPRRAGFLNDREPPDPSSTGLDPTLAAALAYLLGPISGILLLLAERESLFVRFHAMQSTITFIGLMVVAAVSGIVPLLGWLIHGLTWLLSMVLWVLLMVKAFQGEWFMLPVVGEMAEQRTQLPR